jgi:hypothetical protein
MKVLIRVGNEDQLIRGAENCIELCEQIKRRNKETGKVEKFWEAKKYYSTLEGLFHALLNMKIRACDASDLRELKLYLTSIRNELMDFYNTKLTH